MTDAPSVRYRSATAEDAVAIADLLTDSLPLLLPDASVPPAPAFVDSLSVPAVRERLASDAYRYIVATLDGELLGFAALRDGSHLYHLFVGEPHQGHGIGRALWNAIRDLADVAQITVNAAAPSIPVYERLGFSATAAINAASSPPYQPMCWQRDGEADS